MRTERRTTCVACGGSGTLLHRGVTDRLFGVPGCWDVWRCDTCESLWLDPRPHRDDIAEAYVAYYTHTADDAGATPSLRGRSRYRRMLDAFHAVRHRGPWSGSRLSAQLQALPIRMWAGRAADARFEAFYRPVKPGGRALDVGAGRGYSVERLRSLGWDASGIDPDEAAVAAGLQAGIPLASGDLASQGYPDESFDLLTMSHVIEHVHEPAGLLVECLRVLRPDGELVVVTPNARALQHRRAGGEWFALDPPRHLQIFTRQSLSKLLEQAGFVDVTVRTSVRGANTNVAGQRAFRRGERFDMTVAPSWRDRLAAELAQEAEAVSLLFDRDAGEDLVAVARRP